MWSLSEWGSIPAPERGVKPLLGGFLGSAEDERKNRIKTGGAQAASGRITAVRSAGCFKGFHRAAKWGKNMGMGSQGYVLGGKAV